LNNSIGEYVLRPDYREPYKPLKWSLKFFSWVNAHIKKEQNVTPRMHYQMYDELIGVPDINVQALVHRGGAKSTVLTTYLPIYIAVNGTMDNFGPVHNLVIFSATVEQAVDQLKAVRDIWENNEIIQEYLHLAKTKAGKVVADKVDYVAWTNRQGHTIHIQAKGAGQSMRGTRKNGTRPQVCIFDDILPDAILTSELERKKLKTWFYSTVAQAVDITHFKKIVVGTPMTNDDLLMLMARGSSYKTIMFPVANEFPVPVEEMITSWKDRFTPERVMKAFTEAKESHAEDDFYREMMLEVVNEEMRIFKNTYYREFDYNSMKKHFHTMNFFTTMDLAVSKKESGDYVFVMTIGVNAEGHWFLVKIDGGRFDPTETIDILFDHVKAFQPIEVRAEKAALQQVLDHFIELKMRETNTFFYYTGLENNSMMSKNFRINGLRPLMKRGRIHFVRDRDETSMAELYYEMRGYTKIGGTTAHDDAIDCLANFLDPGFVVAPAESSGTEVASMSDEDMEGDSLDDYYD